MSYEHPFEKILVGVIILLVGVVLIHYPWDLSFIVAGTVTLLSGIISYIHD